MVKNLLKNSKKIIRRQQSNILSAAAIITFANFLSAALGFVRERILVSYFFKSPALRAQLDAYRIASRLPEFAFQLLVIGALSAAFIPVFSKYLNKNKKEAYLISSSIINLVLLAFGIVSIIIFIFAYQFNDLITSTNFTPSQIALAAKLTRIMLFAQLFFTFSNFLTGIIQSQRRFLIPALSPLAHNLGIIAGIILLTPTFGIYSAAIGIVFGAFLHLAFQLPLAKQLGFSYKLTIKLKHLGVKEMIRLIPPRTLAISVTQIELLALSFFATALTTGTLTIFELAQRLISAPIRVFSVPIGQASLPFLSHQSNPKMLFKFKRTFLSSLHQILYLAFPAGIILLVLRIPMVRILYGAKNFPWSATLLTGKTVAILSLSIFAQSAIHLLNRTFYALENTKKPLLIALFSVILNISLAASFTFIFKFGILGLATAITIASIFQATFLLITLSRSIGGFPAKDLLLPPFKMFIATLFTGIFLWVPMRLLDQFVFDTTRTLPLILLTIIAGISGSLVYIGLSILFGIKELKSFSTLIKRIGNWHKVLDQTEEVIESTSQAQEIKPV